MKTRILAAIVPALFFLSSSGLALALNGEPYIHDPSTVLECDGKFYCWGTQGTGLVSDDGWTWHSGARVQAGAAPDLVHIGDRYYMAYASSGGGLGGGHASTIRVKWSKTLDPNSPDYAWNDDHVVASSDGIEDCDAIDPGFLLDPNTGRLWVSYGTYFGFIRIVELDPKTGHHLENNKPVNIAIDCEATDPIYHDGWYYLFGTHGTCCDGANSTYNIRVGRSKSPTGPYLDNAGNDMLKGGGKLVVAASGRYVGPGHFGLMELGDGVEKFSCHYEADLDRSGRSVLDIRPLLWKDGWPVAGDNFKEGTYEIQPEAGGGALQTAAGNSSDGNTSVYVRDSKTAYQKWTISAVTNSPGFPGSPCFKITIAGTDRALAAAADTGVTVVPAFTGASEQLWRIDQLTDGTYRIMPKSASNSKEPMVLTMAGGATTLAKFDAKGDKSRWNFKTPGASGNFAEGTYQIQSERSGYALELSVDFVRTGGGGRGGFGGGRGGGGPVTPVPAQQLAQVSSGWPAGSIDTRLGDFMNRPHQLWTITAVNNNGSNSGSPSYRISIAGTDRALAATADAEVATVPAFTGAPEQLWRIDRLADGTYRITPKSVPSSTESLALTAIGYSTPTLAKFDAKSDKSHWNLKTP